jgi:Tol biopolymer transport system component
VDADGNNPVTVVSGIGEISGSPRPAWSPDGSAIAYAALDPQAGSRIFVAPVDGSGARQIGDPALDAWGPSWSPDGTTIAFGGGLPASPEGVRLFLIDADGANVRQISDVRGNGFAFVQTDWSHDGTKIAGQASATDNINEWDIWVINADGSGATNVGAHVGGDELFPLWAPDRDALAWAHAQVVLLEEGAAPVDLPVSGGHEWSPDGELLAVGSDTALVVVDLDGNVQRTIEGPADSVAWQPLFD